MTDNKFSKSLVIKELREIQDDLYKYEDRIDEIRLEAENIQFDLQLSLKVLGRAIENQTG